MRSRFALFFLTLALGTASLLAQNSGPVVRFKTDLGNIDVVLYPSVAPNTVANFLNYVNRGAYNGSFIHRSATNFVIQGGGFKFVNNQTVTIPADPPVVNEFNVSNTRGTLAMAKLGGDPNSATNQWFFNESNTNAGPPANLDSTNGGSTVFGRITNNAGLAVMDAIAALPITNAGSPFDELPVRNYTSGTIQDANLVHLISLAVLANDSLRTDFDSDGSSDYLLVNPSNLLTAIWHLNGNSFVNGAYTRTLPAGWTIVGVADINNDLHPDYLLVNPASLQTAIWYHNDTTFLSSVYGPSLPAGWDLIAATDFNADGHPDYLLFNPSTRQSAIWYLNGTARTGTAFGPSLPAGWTLINATDFNGDSKPDLLLANPQSRQTAVWYLNGASRTGTILGRTLPAGWTLQGAGDFNGDSKPDYVLYEASTRRTALWYLNGVTFTGSAFGPVLANGFSLVAP